MIRTIFDKATLSLGTIRVISKVALMAGSSQQGKALRASVAWCVSGWAQTLVSSRVPHLTLSHFKTSMLILAPFKNTELVTIFSKKRYKCCISD